MKYLLFLLFFPIFVFAQNTDIIINDFLLRQEYENAQKFCENLKYPDSLFFISLIEYSKLVDYESYETENGKKLLDVCQKALNETAVLKDSTLIMYRTAVLSGMLSTAYIKRGAYLQGISKMTDSQKNWEKLIKTKYSNEADFALSLMQYYKITLFNKTPKKTEKLDAVLKSLEKSLSSNDEISNKLYLSYIWVLHEQKLWDEAQKIFDVFSEKYPQNTMMIRAMQAIFTEQKNIEAIKKYSQKLYDLSTARDPKNYSDILSAKRAEIFALDFENQKDRACKTAEAAISESKNIPPEIKKTYWVKKHLEAIKKYDGQCK